MKLVELDRGSKGQQVQMLQHLLNTTGRQRPPLVLDGAFGPRTERAVRSYQGGHALEVDGIVGRHTWTALGADRAAVPPARPAAPTRAVPIPPVRRLQASAARPERLPHAPAPVPAPARTAPVEQPPGSDIGAPWMRIAIAEKGVAEIKGGRHTRRIVEYHAATGLAAKEDEVAWCASFVNWCLREAGIRGNNSARAKDFGSWGQALETPRYGCIVHLFRAPRGVDGRTGSASGNHVAFFISQTATHVTLLGGNQGDRVRVSNYPLSQYRVKAMRWPTGR